MDKQNWKAVVTDGKFDSFAWPGGYPIEYVCDDGAAICADCMNDRSNPIHFKGNADGWRIEGFSILHPPDDESICAHCNKDIANS